MMLISILFCLALQRFANVGGWFQPAWFETYLRSLSPWVSKLDERLAILLIIVPVLLLFVFCHFIFVWKFSSVFDLFLAVIVLFFCIDARDLNNKLKPYFENLNNSDLHGASNVVTNFIGDDVIGNMTELHRAVTKAILAKSFEQVFAGLFWFIVFGIYGVATYFFLSLIRRHALKVNSNYVELAKLAAKIQDILEWIPSRILGFSFALVGNFNKGASYCSKNLWSGVKEVKRYVIESGLAALDVSSNVSEADQNENRMALDMINRVLIVWLVGVTLVLIGILL